MTKIYVLDTNIMLADPNAIHSFDENEVVIPTVVLQEVDTKKTNMDGIGVNARHFSRLVDKLRLEGNLNNGIKLHNGGLLRTSPPPHFPDVLGVYEDFKDDSNDTAIVATAKQVAEDNKDKAVILVSKDMLVRIKANAVGVLAEDYYNDKVEVSDEGLYQGFTELKVKREQINQFFDDKELESPQEFNENHYVILKCGKQSALTRYNNGKLKPLYQFRENDIIWGLQHRNVQQMLALDLLLDPDVPLVTLQGKAGTGKTLLALASALKLTQDDQAYNKLTVARPIVSMGKDLGYLPGELEEKIRPWMQPIYDNLEFLFNCKDKNELDDKLAGYEDIIQVQALSYIRGRSIPNQILIVDEAQNLSKHEAKTILTRIGEGTKIILTGDPNQIDHPYLDAYSNGLTHVVEKMKDQKMSGHITLTKGERSDLAQLCADIL